MADRILIVRADDPLPRGLARNEDAAAFMAWQYEMEWQESALQPKPEGTK